MADRLSAGVGLFNQGRYFEAHEVWEDLWSESHGDERRFYQGLIQAAVGLFHFSEGNLGGAAKLYRSSRDYMAGLGPRFLGLGVDDFWEQMTRCFGPLLESSDPDRGLRPAPDLLPAIALDPPPEQWPDPDEYVSDD